MTKCNPKCPQGTLIRIEVIFLIITFLIGWASIIHWDTWTCKRQSPHVWPIVPHAILPSTGKNGHALLRFPRSVWLHFCLQNKAVEYFLYNRRPYIEGFLPKGPYLPCVSMAGMAYLAGYHRYWYNCRSNFVTCSLLVTRYSGFFFRYLAQCFWQFSNRCCCLPVIVIHCVERSPWRKALKWTHK